MTALGLEFGDREARSSGRGVLTCSLHSPGTPEQRWDMPVSHASGLVAGGEDDLVALVERLRRDPAVAPLTEHGEPLWLAVTTDHPTLPGVDWESALSPLALPLLRLPGRIGVPTPPPRRPRIAVCAATPVAKEFYAVDDLVADVVDRIAAEAAVPAEIHVFADADWTAALRARLPVGVTVHDPFVEGPHDVAGRGSTPATGSGGQPWTDWIARVMGHTGLDVLHLIGHGFLAAGEGGYAVAEAPDRNFARRTARFVWPQQVAGLLSVLGGWALVTTAVPANYSVPGLRLLTSQVAALRSAAVACHDLRQAAPSALTDVYRALLAYPTAAPRESRGLMVSMHPERFGAEPLVPAPYTPAPSLLAELVEFGDDVSPELLGTRRQIAQWENQLAVRVSSEHLAASRAGLELAKARFDQVLRSSRRWTS